MFGVGGDVSLGKRGMCGGYVCGSAALFPGLPQILSPQIRSDQRPSNEVEVSEVHVGRG